MWARPAILAAALCAVGPAEATDEPSTPTLMALSALEILHAELRNPNATLVDVVRDAAATVAFQRDAAGDTLASLIRQVLSAGGGRGASPDPNRNRGKRRKLHEPEARAHLSLHLRAADAGSDSVGAERGEGIPG